MKVSSYKIKKGNSGHDYGGTNHCKNVKRINHYASAFELLIKIFCIILV